MPNYIDHRLSARASREFRRVAQGKTDITPLRTGGEIRNAAWQYKKMKYAASYALLTPEAQEEISSAFYAANAMLLLFRYRDYGDFKVVDSPLTVVEGTTTPVQLTKRYYFGPAHADRMIQAIVSATVKDASGDPIAGTVDMALGLFTPDENWPAGVPTWSGKFDVWVRFNSDDFDMTMHTLDIATTDIELVERRAYA
jgi:uncharacterized protein (TIGR02217 family)